MLDFDITNAIFSDLSGYLWMLHQAEREMSLEEQSRMLAEQGEHSQS